MTAIHLTATLQLCLFPNTERHIVPAMPFFVPLPLFVAVSHFQDHFSLHLLLLPSLAKLHHLKTRMRDRTQRAISVCLDLCPPLLACAWKHASLQNPFCLSVPVNNLHAAVARAEELRNAVDCPHSRHVGSDHGSPNTSIVRGNVYL